MRLTEVKIYKKLLKIDKAIGWLSEEVLLKAVYEYGAFSVILNAKVSDRDNSLILCLLCYKL